jgi:hypothetical protein
MARKPIPGGDPAAWGTTLNDFLDVAHTADGLIKADALQGGAVNVPYTATERAKLAAIGDIPATIRAAVIAQVLAGTGLTRTVDPATGAITLSLTAPASAATARTTVDRAVSSGRSHLALGFNHVDNSLRYPGSAAIGTAQAQALALLRAVFPSQTAHIHGFGNQTAWPVEGTEPTAQNWADSGIDSMINLIKANGGESTLYLYGIPPWMGGHRNTASEGGGLGTYTMQTSAFQSSPVSWDQFRVRDDKLDKWDRLVELHCLRYLAPPFDVRRFNIWNELKGYYNPQTNRWDLGDGSAVPVAATAQHGYVHLYNRTWAKIRAVAQTLGISLSEIVIDGPYIVVDSWGTSNAAVAPSGDWAALAGDRGYGWLDGRLTEDIGTFMRYASGYSSITLDSRNFNRPDSAAYAAVSKNGPFGGVKKLADLIAGIRALPFATYPNARTVPVHNAELYLGQQYYAYGAHPTTTDQQYNAAIWAAGMVEVIQADRARPSGGPNIQTRWGNDRSEDDSWVWTTPDGSATVLPTPVYNAMKFFTDHFPNNTQLYPVALTGADAGNILAIASATKLLVINKSAGPILLNTGSGDATGDVTLAAHDVRVF